MFSFFKSKSVSTPIESIKVSHDGLFINDHKISVNFSKGDFKKILGNPDRNELVNVFQCFIYDKIGLDIFFNDDETFDRLGIDFEYRGMKHSPDALYYGSDNLKNDRELLLSALLNKDKINHTNRIDEILDELF